MSLEIDVAPTALGVARSGMASRPLRMIDYAPPPPAGPSRGPWTLRVAQPTQFRPQYLVARVYEQPRGGLVCNAELSIATDVFVAGGHSSYPDRLLGRRRATGRAHARSSGRLAGSNMASAPGTPPSHYAETPTERCRLLGTEFRCIGDCEAALETFTFWTSRQGRGRGKGRLARRATTKDGAGGQDLSVDKAGEGRGGGTSRGALGAFDEGAVFYLSAEPALDKRVKKSVVGAPRRRPLRHPSTSSLVCVPSLLVCSLRLSLCSLAPLSAPPAGNGRCQ